MRKIKGGTNASKTLAVSLVGGKKRNKTHIRSKSRRHRTLKRHKKTRRHNRRRTGGTLPPPPGWIIGANGEFVPDPNYKKHS